MIGYRTSLLNIVDNDIPSAGMTVDDAGNVTAPKVPTGDTSTKPVVTLLLQQGLNSHAADLQTRVKTLLNQFADTEGKAAQSITDDLQLLTVEEKAPDAAGVRSQVQDILDGKAQLPTDPKALHAFWETLTPAEKDALWKHDHYLGNRDGLPSVDRDHYNRLTLQDELARAQAGDPAVKDKLADLQTVSAQVDKPDRYLLQLDTQSGARPHVAIAAGNPDTASNVSTFVPGTGSRPSKMGSDMVRVDAMREEAKNRGGAAHPSVIAWYGYDAPEGLTNATQQHYADAAAPALDRFQDGLRASHDGSPSYNTVIGHSYGTTVVGDAAGHGRSLNADAVAFVASPGTTLDHANDVNLTGVSHDEVAKHVFATKAANDPVPDYADGRAGMYTPGMDDFRQDPTSSNYGAQVFASDPGKSDWYEGGYSTDAHSQYWDQNSKSLHGIGDIIAGHGDKAVQIK